MSHIEKKIMIHAPVDRVYDVARDPNRWNTWWVGLSEPEQVNGKGEAGTIVKHQFLMAGIPFPITSKVVEDKRDPKEAHWKGNFEGPIEGHQEWDYIARGNDTEVIARIDYTVPGKALGKLADKMIIEKMQERSAEQTLENLKLLVESTKPQATA